MSKTRIEGSFVATVTPFDRRGEIDFGAWQALLDHQQRHGTRAILFMGSTGEPSLLSPEEKKRIIVETVKMRTGGMAFFYGCTGPSTEQVIENVRFAAANGADGAIIAAPPYICASEADIEAHARKSSPALLDDGVDKVKAGVTTVEEVARVVREEA